MGEYEPNDSRNVTGADAGERQQQQMNQSTGSGMRSPGGADQQMGGDRWSGDSGSGQMGQQGDAQGQQSQFESDRQSGGQDWSTQIREHMEVIGADGTHVGTVDHMDGHRIKLTRRENDAGHEGGTHSGHHHYLSSGLIAEVEGDKVRLSANGDVAWGMLEEE